jgi:hypothetical protein
MSRAVDGQVYRLALLQVRARVGLGVPHAVRLERPLARSVVLQA